MLRERGLISEDDLKNALALQQERRDKLGRILVDLGYVAERDVLNVVSEQLKVPIFNGDYPAVPVESAGLPFRFLRAFNAIPVHVEDKVLSLVMADALDVETQNAARLRGTLDPVFQSNESGLVELEGSNRIQAAMCAE